MPTRASMSPRETQLRQLLARWEREHGGEKPQFILDAHAQLDQLAGQRRQGKRLKKAWNHILGVVGKESPDAKRALETLAESPSDGAALELVGAQIAKAAGKAPELGQALGTIMPMLKSAFTDDDDEKEG